MRAELTGAGDAGVTATPPRANTPFAAPIFQVDGFDLHAYVAVAQESTPN